MTTYTADHSPFLTRLARAFTKRWGSTEARQRVWNSEYNAGKWDGIPTEDEAGERDPIYGYLAHYGAGASILDLGCGDGITAREMDPDFSSYLGVDVSDLAIERARLSLGQMKDRAGKVRFAVGDIYSFESPEAFSVILFRESIYYVPQHRISGMLARYRNSLAPGGVLMVRLCDRSRYRKIIDLLHREFSVTEFYQPPKSTLAILVCSAAGRQS